MKQIWDLTPEQERGNFSRIVYEKFAIYDARMQGFDELQGVTPILATDTPESLNGIGMIVLTLHMSCIYFDPFCAGRKGYPFDHTLGTEIRYNSPEDSQDTIIPSGYIQDAEIPLVGKSLSIRSRGRGQDIEKTSPLVRAYKQTDASPFDFDAFVKALDQRANDPFDYTIASS
jgi:hypothetical protein